MNHKQRSGLLGVIMGCTLLVLGNLHAMPLQAVAIAVGVACLLLGSLRFLAEEEG